MNVFSFDWELPFLESLQGIHNPFLDGFFGFVTHLGDKGLFWIGLAVLLLIFARTRKIGLSAGIALVLSVIFTNVVIKMSVNRARPWMEDAILNGGTETLKAQILAVIPELPDDSSFPSGHTSASFASAVAILIACISDFKLPKADGSKKNPILVVAGVLAVILAALIGFSRNYIGVHYPTDVMVGTVVGTIYGIGGFLIANALWKALAPKLAAKFAKKKS